MPRSSSADAGAAIEIAFAGTSRRQAPQDAGTRLRGSAMTVFLAHFLIVLAAWTITIKFLFPIAYAFAEGTPITAYIYWDFWWVIHLWLAWALLRWPPYVHALALAVSGVEIVIIVTKLALFLSDPTWTIWSTNWFINKLFVLACFVLMLGYLALHRWSTTPARPHRRERAPRGRRISYLLS
jgi:hypothetical protein